MIDKASIFSNIDKNLLSKFKEYHLKNPKVYTQFKVYAQEMRSSGKNKYSAWTIINIIRWNHDIKNEDIFKINNDFIALYARLLIYHDSDYGKFFELRTMKPSDRRDSSEEIYRANSSDSTYLQN